MDDYEIWRPKGRFLLIDEIQEAIKDPRMAKAIAFLMGYYGLDKPEIDDKNAAQIAGTMAYIIRGEELPAGLLGPESLDGAYYFSDRSVRYFNVAKSLFEIRGPVR